AYLIIGVTDDFEVIGIDEACKSNNILDLMNNKKFAGDFKPEIEIKNIYYKYKKLMVIKCKATKHVPYYLVERYRGVKDNTIYTRVGDTNTPKDKSATYNEIEKLWRIHFDREHE
uniref:AlbA family DNA-binding domain-containing protein n=1 Tax=Catenibacterium sp. TaxID=2049022 RepID=UPI004027D835